MNDVASAAGTATGNEIALLTAVVESAREAVVSLDPELRITSWNPAAEALYGWTAAEARGADARILLPGGDAAEFERVLAGERLEHAEVARVRKDGARIIVGETVSPVRAADGTIVGVATISRDVSERRRFEDELARTRRALEDRNRRLEQSNSELQQFAYVASHDLSEPLRSIAGMVGLLARRYKGRLDADADEFIAFAIQGCERMRTMIDDVLEFSRVGRHELFRESLVLDEVVGAAMKALSTQISDSGAVIAYGGLGTVYADRSQICQLFQNGISNAIKFRRDGVPPVVTITTHRLAEAVRVEIGDNGIGIEPQYHERIFRMFQRLHAKDDYPGTGIGLAIAQRIVDRHGGSIGVAGNYAGGTTLWFTLPKPPDQALKGGRG